MKNKILIPVIAIVAIILVFAAIGLASNPPHPGGTDLNVEINEPNFETSDFKMYIPENYEINDQYSTLEKITAENENQIEITKYSKDIFALFNDGEYIESLSDLETYLKNNIKFLTGGDLISTDIIETKKTDFVLVRYSNSRNYPGVNVYEADILDSDTGDIYTIILSDVDGKANSEIIQLAGSFVIK